MIIRLACLMLLVLGLCTTSIAEAQSMAELRTRLQAALQRNLSRSMLDGALHHIDLQTGEVTRYYPTENHEVILKLGEIYVMCATLVTKSGSEALVDYYIAESNGRYRIIRTEIDNRAPLNALISSGRATRLE